MGTIEVLNDAIVRTHEDLASRLRHLRSGDEHPERDPERPRAEYVDLDTFLAATSKHLHAVDEVLLPPAARRLEHGKQRVKDYLATVKQLEVELNHVKAHAYGSVYESGVDWSEIWPDVAKAMSEHYHAEARLSRDLTALMEDPDVMVLTDKLRKATDRAPSRPHPFLPHTGPLGVVARAVTRRVDAFWDTAEGRMSPQPVHPPHPVPGLMARYVMGDPYFEATDPDREEKETGS